MSRLVLTVAEVYESWSRSQGHITAKTAATGKSAWHSRVEPQGGEVAVADVKTAAVRAISGVAAGPPRAQATDASALANDPQAVYLAISLWS
jgi:hypothetical protein